MKKKQYDDEFKVEAVKLALESEVSYAEIARDLGIKYGTLITWIHNTMNKPKFSREKHEVNKLSKVAYQALERQNRAMAKELDLRKKEIEFLKKASAYFASLK